MEKIEPEHFYSHHPPERIVGVEVEYNTQVPSGAMLDGYISGPAIQDAGYMFMYARSRNQKFLSNGAKIYPDVSHLEYCTPECLGPHEAAAADIAGIDVLSAIVKSSQKEHNGIYRVSGTTLRQAAAKTYTNGVHENYMIPTEIAYDPFFEGVIGSHLASRIWATSGEFTREGYTFSQKASGIGGGPVRFSVAGSGRTFSGQKPMVLIPSEVDDRDVVGGVSDWSRMEVRFSDPLHSLEGQKTSLAVTSLAVRLIEQRLRFRNERFLDVMIKDPTTAAKSFMSDLSLKNTVEVESGKEMSALDVGEQLATMALELTGQVELPADEVASVSDWLGTIDALRRSSPAVVDYDEFLLRRYDMAAKHNYLARKGFLDGDDIVSAQGASLFWDRISPEGVAQKYWRALQGEDREVRRLKTAPPLTRAAVRAAYVIEHFSDASPEDVEWSGHGHSFTHKTSFSDPYGFIDR